MEHGHDHGMGGGMAMGGPPPSPGMTAGHNNNDNMPRRHMMMHMSFYWGSYGEFLFSGWPGSSSGMYVIALLVVFLLAVVVEWLSRAHLVRRTQQNDVVSGLILTVLHAVRMGLAYLVMLAVMSFNGGVLLVAVAGHALGFLVFGTKVFGSGRKKEEDPNLPPYEKASDHLPPMSC